MKKSYILGILVIAVAVMVIVSTAGDASTYVSFGEAYELATEGSSGKLHVVGQLKKDSNGQVIGIETSPDKLAFSFIMVDQDSVEQKVIYNEPMPMDFLRSEQVVVVGAFKNQTFIADKILMKCPSKYQEEEIKIGEVR